MCRSRTVLSGCVVAAIMLVSLPPVIDGLLCFQCATTDKDHLCKTDYWGFVNQSKGIAENFNYIKNCTDTNPLWDRCMIETTEQDGVIQHFHRGCHDGKTFHERFDSPRFYNLNPNNATTCAHVVTLTCYTFCDTDLCNGPQIPPNKTECVDNVYGEGGETCGAPSVRTLDWFWVGIPLLVMLANALLLK